MVAKTSRNASTTSSSKQRSSLQSPSTSCSTASRSYKPSSVTSFVQSSAKKSVKTAKSPASRKKNGGNNKFRDSEKRELLDGQTNDLFVSGESGTRASEGNDPFSYGAASSADKMRTRRQVDEAALALDLLMKS